MGFSLKPSDKKIKEPKKEEPSLVTTQEAEVASLTIEEFNPWNYIRVVNVRGDSEFLATPDEKVIVGHRGNPILGNKHVMQNKSMKERDRVIAEHKKDLDKDLEEHGPIWHTLQDISKEIIEKKQKIAISCFCAPSPCHNHLLIPVIVQMVEEMIEMNKEQEIIKKLKL